MGDEPSDDRPWSANKFYDMMTLDIVRSLQQIPGIQEPSLIVHEPCPKQSIASWEHTHSCVMPQDLKNFYMSMDGFLVTWSYDCGGRTVLPIGNLNINSLCHLKRIGGMSKEDKDEMSVALINLDGINKGAHVPKFGEGCKVFELDACPNLAKVCLVYQQNNRDPNLWLLDRGLEWHHLAKTFTQYFRMMLVHLGLPEWQMHFTPMGLPPWASQIMCSLAPHLHSPQPPRKPPTNPDLKLDTALFKVKGRAKRAEQFPKK